MRWARSTPASARPSPRAASASRNWTPRSPPGRRGWRRCSRPRPRRAPPADLFARIEARLGEPPRRRRSRRILRARLAAMARAAGGAGALAAGLAAALAFVVVDPADGPPHQFVAVLQKSADAPAFAMTVDIDKLEFSVRPVAAEAPEGKSYELWIIAPQAGAEVARRDRRAPTERAPACRRPRQRARGDLRRHRRAQGRLAERQAVRRAGVLRQARARRAVIPVHLVTGFLGAGKTSFLNRLLRRPRAEGQPGRRQRIRRGGARSSALRAARRRDRCCSPRAACAARCAAISSTGCCDILRQARRAAFARIVVETSGLADPGPMLHALFADDHARRAACGSPM